eukprot:2629329-Pyramimonas_sp.AAC.1
MGSGQIEVTTIEVWTELKSSRVKENVLTDVHGPVSYNSKAHGTINPRAAWDPTSPMGGCGLE